MIRRLPPIALVAAAALAGCARKPSTAVVPEVFPRQFSVVPFPASVAPANGDPFTITARTSIVADSSSTDVRPALTALLAIIRPSTGFVLPIVGAGAPGPAGPARDTIKHNAIVLRISDADPDSLAYSVRVDVDSVIVTARRGEGLFHGVQTLRQLLPFGIESHQSALRIGTWRISPVAIHDRPNLAWRGAMLDVSRHFFTTDEVKQYLDILALYKLNVLHLHLGDDQGFRIEIKSHPELTAMGAPSEVGGGAGGFYSQVEYADLVRYAADRFIRIVPEIDMPAHINALLLSHPDISCGRRAPAVYTGINVGFSAICPDSEGTYRLLDDVIREISAMSPGGFFHIGGDEVQALNATQYSKFVERVQSIVRKYNVRMVGWEEIGKTALDPTSVIQQWKGDSLTAGNALANDVIVSAAPRLYLDMKYTPSFELGLRWAGYLDVRQVYDWNPKATVKAVDPSRVIGVEAPLWSETPRNITAVEYLVMPRLPAIAEVAWSDPARRDWKDFRLRLAAQAPRWNILGINYYRSTQIPW